MFGRFMPTEGKFFDLFNAHVKEAVLGGEALKTLMVALNDSPEKATALAAEIHVIESRADKITYETVSLLHSTFITPLDRNEIHGLISRLDDVLDTIEDAAQAVTMYDIRRATPEMLRFADIILASVKRVSDAVTQLHQMDNGPAILVACKDIDALESEADKVLHEAMSRLFREETDVRELIKLKAIYETLEAVTDRCDDVANIIESIVLENS
jgi:predicted phosphate transport protein (TIGR00153 family)